MDDAPHPHDIVATVDSLVLTIDRIDFFFLLRSDPFLANKFLWHICKVLVKGKYDPIIGSLSP